MIGALVRRLAGPLLPWLLMAAVVVIGGLIWRADTLSGDLEAMERQRDSAQAAATAASASLAMRSQQYDDLIEALEQYQARTERAEQAVAAHRAAARQLQEDDDAIRDWADTAVPAGVRQWVRDLPADAGNAAGDLPGGAEFYDQAAAGPGEAGGD